MNRRHRWSPTVLIALLFYGCGARGLPMAPLRPVAPPLTDVRVDQLGIDARIRFLIPSPTVFIEGVEVPIDAVELLMVAERYPAMTPDLLAVALDDERMTRLRNARVAASGARDAREQERIAEELRIATERALAAGEPPPTLESLGYGTPEQGDAEAAAASETPAPLSDEELLLRRVPTDYLRSWRDAGLRPASLLESARRLDQAVDLLWNDLHMPTAIVDRSEPPALPDPRRVVQAARQISRTLAYEGELSDEDFLATATVVATITYEDLRAQNQGPYGELSFTVGVPSSGPLRTRYYFAVRALAGRKYNGGIDNVLALAPSSVPVPPAKVTATVIPTGVQIDWTPPAGNLWGEQLSPDLMVYDMYRRLLGEPLPTKPLNTAPLGGTRFIDTNPTWGQRYVYEVRALNAPLRSEPVFGAPTAEVPTDLSKPRRQGLGTESPPVYVFDTFPPAAISGLQATRAANRITLRWQGPAPESGGGYRVYRHEAPAPHIPLDGPVPPPSDLGRLLQELAGEVADREAVSLEQLLATPESPPVDVAAAELPLAALPLCPPLPPTPVAASALASPVLGASTQPPEAPRPRRRTGALVRAGWQVVTSTLITDMRYLDPTATPDRSWVYLVEAVDATGNAGPLACVGMPMEAEQ